MSSLTRVGIWGVFGHGNYGNEATLGAFLAQLDPARFAPVLLTNDCDRAAELHGVAARQVSAPFARVSRNRLGRAVGAAANRSSYLRGAFRMVRDLDAVVVAGTGGLEHAGSFGTPFEIWTLALACWARRKPYLLLDIGVDPQRRRTGRAFVRWAGALASYRSYRDERSRAAMRANGLRAARADPVVTDMAFALHAERAAAHDGDVVVVGVMRYDGNTDQPSLPAYESYLERCTVLVRALLAAHRRVVLVVGDDEDRPSASALARRSQDDRVVLSPAASPSELTAVMSGAATVVASRYHTLIFALLAGTPVVSIGYSAKNRAMLAQFRLPDTHRDAAEFDPVEVAGLVAQSVANREALSVVVSSGVAQARERLDQHWPDVLGAICLPRRRRARPSQPTTSR